MNTHFSKHTSRQLWVEHCQSIKRFVNAHPQRVMGITTVSQRDWFETAVFYTDQPKPGPIDCKLQVSPHEQIFGHVASEINCLCNYICVDHTSWGETHRCWAIWFYPEEDVCPTEEVYHTTLENDQKASAEHPLPESPVEEKHPPPLNQPKTAPLEEENSTSPLCSPQVAKLQPYESGLAQKSLRECREEEVAHNPEGDDKEQPAAADVWRDLDAVNP
eukprot:TRINITY_DN17175_c0_g1_i1.p1 TRINITY_DN17175_c0_g1~~TRINITY_DN17175_c0_g1_i1.p1  ORF type:complete len:218 (+),score=24.34 TRINITY_DN17175_c0_g1_i1:36-689(+)